DYCCQMWDISSDHALF
nr:immunoglobulin light chain junction region [Macaca mulatta]